MSSPGRLTASLDGRWELELVDVPGQRHPAPFDVQVPGSWTLQVPGAELADGTVRYRRTFSVPSAWPADGELVLHFGAVNHCAEVSVNGHDVGRHEGGWTPFELQVDRALLVDGEQSIEVLVSYPPLLAPSADSWGMQEVPHGKQTWYGTNAGIWQSVTLVHRPSHHLEDVLVRTEAASGVVTGTATVTAPGPAGAAAVLVVREVQRDGSTSVVASSEPVLVDGSTGPVGRLDLSVTVPSPRLWSPSDPAIYSGSVELVDAAGAVTDSVTVTTGFRTVESKDGLILLNGEPIELRGILDQDYHPGSELKAATVDELEALFTEVKRLGFNLLRCHIRRPDPIYFDIANRVGLMVWAELPSWQRFTKRSAAAAEALLEEMITLDGHHPSIVAWSVVNESWGVDLADAEQRAWMARTQRWAKTLAPSTLVVDNSACETNFHVHTDIDDFHVYRGMPERRASWDEWVDEFVDRPAWSFTPYGDAERTGEEPLVVSEFGNWGLPDIAELAGPDGLDPWWAAPGRDWAFGAAEATDTVGRFYKHRLDEVFGSWQGFVEATQRQQLLGTRYQIGSLRRRPQIAGYVLTQLSDVQWEANGLFDMDRRPRMFVDALALINGPATVVVRPETYSAVAGTALTVRLDVVAPAGHADLGDAWQLQVTLDDGETQLLDVPAGVRSAHELTVQLPSVASASSVRAELHVDGRLVGRDIAEVLVLPTPVPRTEPVRTTDVELAYWLQSIGVAVTDGEDPSLLVTRQFDTAAQAFARSGGRVLVVAEDKDALGDAFEGPLLARLVPRDGDGDWVPRFDWLRRDGAFAALPGGPMLDLAYEDVIGDLLIDGLPAPLRPARLHSAVFAGWLQHRASTTVTVPWSAGAVTITTFKLRTADHPVAAALTHAMLDCAQE